MHRCTTPLALFWSVVLVVVVGAGCGDDAPADVGVDSGVDSALPDTSLPDTTPPDTGPDYGYVPVSLYTPVVLPEDELAALAFTILAGESEEDLSCTTCHGLTLDRVQGWGTATNAALDCIGTLDPNLPDDADAILDCFLNDDMETDHSVLSLLTTAVQLDWFARLLEIEHWDAMDTTETDNFTRRFTMPRRPVDLLGQGQVNVLLTWVRAGMPLLEEQITGGGTRCVPMIGPEVAAHVTAMETEGWDVLNRDRGLVMFGCEAGETGVDCLSTLPDSTEEVYADGWAIDGNLKILYTTDYPSSYWTRSSADGRFISHGGGSVGDSSIIDLDRGIVLPVDAFYDPGFFPDNSGFVLQGVGGRDGGWCPQPLLETATEVTFMETGCSVFGAVGLYQHVAAVDGGDYWTVFGQFVSDNGGHDVTGPLDVSFGTFSRTSFVPIIHEGDAYRPRETIRVSTPFEGDAVISPSGRMVLSRVQGTDGTQSGFALRELRATPAGMTYDVEAPIVASFCERGAKVGFSFDERYVVYHRYITGSDAVELGFTGSDDPAFMDYRTQGGANLFLLDITNGDRRRITNMNPGQYALFPHFRSDGWIYFVVRDPTDGIRGEYMVASDAALVTPP